jgi:hypothetical protein
MARAERDYRERIRGRLAVCFFDADFAPLF